MNKEQRDRLGAVQAMLEVFQHTEAMVKVSEAHAAIVAAENAYQAARDHAAGLLSGLEAPIHAEIEAEQAKRDANPILSRFQAGIDAMEEAVSQVNKAARILCSPRHNQGDADEVLMLLDVAADVLDTVRWL